MPAPPYYVDVVSCEENCPVVCNHNVPDSCEGRDGSMVSPEDKGWIPRGSTTRATPGDLDLMWILINPGNPLPTIEHNLYSEKEGAELADAAWALTERVLEGKGVESPTLSETIADAATVLKCEPFEVLDRCMVTNIVRCSTPVGWGSAFAGLNRVTATKRQIIRTCYQKHLKQEVDYWKPKAIVAGSAASRDALCDNGLEWECRACGVMSRRFWDRSTKSFACRACDQAAYDWGFIAHPTAHAHQGGRYDPVRPKNLAALSDMMRVLWD